ncbi:MAG TPA: GNAT family N-acetyltransferase [Candidatus Bathyarchaeia archaeon]|nr:GNAT family N-acetyltransferase [Candidatus Bathyarchaeia archaeon]
MVNRQSGHITAESQVLSSSTMRSLSLKDGRKVVIRAYTPADKEGLVSMYADLSEETLRWSLPPYDRKKIERWTTDLENRIILLAFSGDKVVGHLQITSYAAERLKGIGDLVIYLHQDFQKAGMGAALMKEGIGLARARGWHRIALRVVADNHRAINLYEKMGFRKEGLSRDNYFGADGKYHDEVEMGLLL